MAKHLERTPGLTIAHPPRIAEAIAQSYEGMAHFAGTGPRGATCGGCIHWGNGTGQEARERGCSKFRSMTGCVSKMVPMFASACRYFEPALRRGGGGR